MQSCKQLSCNSFFLITVFPLLLLKISNQSDFLTPHLKLKFLILCAPNIPQKQLRFIELKVTFESTFYKLLDNIGPTWVQYSIVAWVPNCQSKTEITTSKSFSKGNHVGFFRTAWVLLKAKVQNYTVVSLFLLVDDKRFSERKKKKKSKNT